MRCFDCETQRNLSNDAVATCAVCGAGICTVHAVEGYAEEELRYGLGNPSRLRLPGRRLYCRTCAPAYLATAGHRDAGADALAG
nr:DUF2180 family protein [Propionicimonas sp.]